MRSCPGGPGERPRYRSRIWPRWRHGAEEWERRFAPAGSGSLASGGCACGGLCSEPSAPMGRRTKTGSPDRLLQFIDTERVPARGGLEAGQPPRSFRPTCSAQPPLSRDPVCVRAAGEGGRPHRPAHGGGRVRPSRRRHEPAPRFQRSGRADGRRRLRRLGDRARSPWRRGADAGGSLPGQGNAVRGAHRGKRARCDDETSRARGARLAPARRGSGSGHRGGRRADGARRRGAGPVFRFRFGPGVGLGAPDGADARHRGGEGPVFLGRLGRETACASARRRENASVWTGACCRLDPD